MRGLFTGIGTVVLAIVVLFVTAGGVFDIFSGMFENSDIGTIVGLVAVFIYAGLIVNVGILLAVLFAAIANAIFDN